MRHKALHFLENRTYPEAGRALLRKGRPFTIPCARVGKACWGPGGGDGDAFETAEGGGCSQTYGALPERDFAPYPPKQGGS